MIRLILAFIGLLVILFAIANLIGGAMWDFADSMPLWWESEDENRRAGEKDA